MLVMLHGRQGDDRVRVIGGADDHGIDLLVHLVEHDAKVLELRGLGILGELLGGVLLIHVAQRDDVVAQLGHLIHVAAPLAADADAGHVELVVGGKALRRLAAVWGRSWNAATLAPVAQRNCRRLIRLDLEVCMV